MRLSRRSAPMALLLITLLTACAAPSQRASGAPEGQAPPSQPTGPKRVVTAMVNQPLVWVERLRNGPRWGGWNLYELTSAGMTLLDNQGELQPQLVESVPSLDNGLWKVNPDGTMETTWKLKPNLKWHDG